MEKRKTKVLQTELTAEEAEQALGIYAAAHARMASLTSKMDVEITRIREKYQEEMSKLSGIQTESFEKVQHYATINPQLFLKKKSIDMTHGTLGFRTSTPALKLITKFTWGSVLTMVKEFMPDYIRTKEEVDKESILAQRDSEVVSANLTKCGMRVVQDETFFIDLKKEEAIAI